METETISARNIVDLLLQEHYAAGICGTPKIVDDTKAQVFMNEAHRRANRPAAFVLGWDCE